MSVHLKYVGYDAVREATEELAQKLRERFGTEELSRFRFQAIPRGGLFVLGYLGYYLGLTAEQFEFRGQPGVVLVDDCSISGARFAEYRREQSVPVVFAHLYSHPDLRTEIERDPAVLSCVSARDLVDYAPVVHSAPDAHAAWRQRWQERLEIPRYWLGMPERIAFPWTEPDTLLWNPQTRQVERGWRLASPDRCLHNYVELGGAEISRAQACFRVPDAVAYRLGEDEVSLCDFRTEECYRLQGAAGAMWRILAAGGDLDATVDKTVSDYEVPRDEAAADVVQFIDQLLLLGLLERREQV